MWDNRYFNDRTLLLTIIKKKGWCGYTFCDDCVMQQACGDGVREANPNGKNTRQVRYEDAIKMFSKKFGKHSLLDALL